MSVSSDHVGDERLGVGGGGGVRGGGVCEIGDDFSDRPCTELAGSLHL